MIHRFIERWRSWRLNKDIKAGRVKRGRRDEGATAAKAEPLATLNVRVYRAASDSWEEIT